MAEAIQKFVNLLAERKDSPALFLAVGTSAAVVIGTFLWRTFGEKGGAFLDRKRKMIKITEVEQVSHDTKRIRLGFPSKKMILGLPCGKHFKIFMKNPNKGGETWNGRPDAEKDYDEVERQYTPITGDETFGHVDLMIKCYLPGDVKMPDGKIVSWADGGKLSKHLNDLKVGDKIAVNGPFGLINYKGNGEFKIPSGLKTYKNIGMMAGGSGLTPMLQIAQYAIDNDTEPGVKFSLIYANKTEDDILCKDLLDKLAARSNGRFKVEYTLDFAPAGWKGSTGFITDKMISKHLPPPAADTLILMCGPPPMIQYACKANLDTLGYDKKCTATF